MLLSAAHLAVLTAHFLAKTGNMTCDAATFDAAVEWLSESIPVSDQYEQISMSLGLA